MPEIIIIYYYYYSVFLFIFNKFIKLKNQALARYRTG